MVAESPWKPQQLTPEDVNLKKIMMGIKSHMLHFVPVAVHIENHQTILSNDNVREVVQTVFRCGTPVVSDSSLPNYLSKITTCSFAIGKTPFRNVDPLVHVFSKAWPMRCSIRNFQDIVSNYIVKEHSVYKCMMAILYCFLSGNYAHSEKQADFDIQKILYKHFVWNPISAHHLSKWIKQGHQQIMFSAIKEYIVYSIAQIPALQDTLDEVYPWQQFRKNVIQQSNDLRQVVFQKIGTADPFGSVVAVANATKGLKCTHTCASWKLVMVDFLSIMRNVSMCPAKYTTYPARFEVFNRIKQLPRDSIMKSAECLGIHSELMNEVQNAFLEGGWKCKQRVAARKIFQSMSRLEQYKIHEFAHAWFAHLSARLYPLPNHIFKMQKKALRRACASPLMYMCICCKQLRGFVVDNSSACKTAWAKGNHKVLYDDYTGDLYCGRKVEKITAATTTTESYWKYQQAQMCTRGKLIQFNLLGNVLSLSNSMYSLCCKCACKMEISNDRFSGDMFCCVHCQYKSMPDIHRICSHCMEKNPQTKLYQCKNSSVRICSKCNRCWMNMPVMQNMCENDVHVAINERATKNQVIVRYG
ncbi:MAG: hypothetical protein CMM07_22605 [Rhodopirellula sp.]|nr:hypothetical protein [Rhodopirellula sp.]